MGFKRTSEGRVFFSGEEGTANDHTGKTQRSAKPQQSQQTQLQILTLLKGLNEKLKTTQTERKKMRQELARYKQVIEELENKASQSERAYQDLAVQLSEKTTEGRAVQAEKIARDTLKELSETRKLILNLEDRTDSQDKSMAALKNVQKEQALKMAKATAGYAQVTKRLQETEDKQEDLGNKVEDTISQQARLVRKIDKSIEDRARFMRKIERIEETVIQTRDSLNAKAMVLLTDQSAQAKVMLEDPDALSAMHADDEPLVLKDKIAEDRPFWRRSFTLDTTAVAAMAVICILGGWFISEVQKPYMPDLPNFDLSNFGRTTADQAAERTQVSSAETPPEEPYEGWRIEEDTQAFSEEVLKSPTQTSRIDEVLAAVDDIGAVTLESDEELVALLEKNPDAVATKLNTIEPGAEQVIAYAEPQATTPEKTAEEKLRIAEDTTPEPFVPASPKATNIVASVKADSGLPEMIKKIEEQAFNGVPEAQHDLAAVYTAGHAGVKQDYKRAAYWFKQAADQGIANAAYNLGVLNHQGLGLEQDINEAIGWYDRAADLGHPEARYNLGIAYIEGIGVPYDPVRATEYFKSAAGSGILEASYNLGLIYENGLLGTAKPDEALVWYKTAADAGSPEAKAALEQLARSLDIGLEDVNKLAENMKLVKTGQPVKATAPAQPKPAAPPATSEPAPTQDEKDDLSAYEQKRLEQEQAQVTVAQIQEYLMQLGLYPGPADGVVGPLTGDAIRSYQSLNNLDVDGQATKAVLAHMLANASEHIDWATEEGEVGSREQ